MKSIVSEKGQVTIPKPLRDRLGLEPGTALDFDERDGLLIASKVVRRDGVDEVYGIVDLPGGTDAFIRDVRGDDQP